MTIRILNKEGTCSLARQRFQSVPSYALSLVSCLLLSNISHAAPSITLSRGAGSPTTYILVSGRGFEPNVGVDIFFDIKDETLVITNGRGEFDKARVYVPRSARPGEHWVTALERNNDKGAQQPFLVQTDWGQFRFMPEHDGVNPYENVLNPNTVGSIGLRWSYRAGGLVESSPAVANGVVYVGAEDHNVYARCQNGRVEVELSHRPVCGFLTRNRRWGCLYRLWRF